MVSKKGRISFSLSRFAPDTLGSREIGLCHPASTSSHPGWMRCFLTGSPPSPRFPLRRRPSLLSTAIGVFQQLAGAGIRRFRPRGWHQNNPFRGSDYMISCMVGKLAPNSLHFTRGWSNKSLGGTIYVPSPPKTGKQMLHPRPPPQSLNDSSGPSQIYMAMRMSADGIHR